MASLSRDTGGPAVSVPSLAHAIREYGCDAELMAMDGIDGHHTSNSVSIPSGASAYKGNRVGWREFLEHQLTGKSISIIHDNGLWLPFHHKVARAAARHRCDRIISPRGMLEPWALRQKAWKKTLAWHAYQFRDIRSAAVIHATAAQEAHNIRELGIASPIAVIPNGVDVPPLGRVQNESSGPRQTRTALFLSRLHPKKGLPNLIHAWAALRPAGWRLVIAGPDDNGHRGKIEQMVRNSRLDDVVTFAGPAYGDDKAALYGEADLFVLPTHSENFGVVVAEALAWQVPVITTRGAPWQALETQRCGWWTEIGVDPLVEALREATSLSDEQREEMGARGRALVECEYSWPRIAEQMIEVYRWVLGDGPKPDCVI